MRKILIGLIIFLVCSIIANAIVFSFYFDKYSTSELFERFVNKNKTYELKLPQIPDFYQKNLLVMSFEKNVKDENDFEKWSSSISKKFIEMYNLQEINEHELKDIKIEFVEKNNSNILTKFSAKAFDDDKIIFYELKPNKQFDSLQTVLIVPGSGNQGAADVLDLDNMYKDYFYWVI